ncbi:hypothetical protein IC582_014022 [Cucumis melo]
MGNNSERVRLEERKELIICRETMLPLNRLFRTIHTTLNAPQITTFALHAPKYVSLFPTYFPTDFNFACLSPYIHPFLPFDFWVFVSDELVIWYYNSPFYFVFLESFFAIWGR